MSRQSILMLLAIAFMLLLFIIAAYFMFLCWWSIKIPTNTQGDWSALKRANGYALWSWLLAVFAIILIVAVAGTLIYSGGATAAMAVAKTNGSLLTLIMLAVAAVAALGMGVLATITAVNIRESGVYNDNGRNQKAYKYAVIGAVAGIGGVMLLVLGYVSLILIRGHKEKVAKQKKKDEMDQAVFALKEAKAANAQRPVASPLRQSMKQPLPSSLPLPMSSPPTVPPRSMSVGQI